MSTIGIHRLYLSDLDAIVELEQASWIKGMQASRATIESRFNKGHIMLGALDKTLTQSEQLRAVLSYVYVHSDPYRRASFPNTFEEFSSVPSHGFYNGAYAYNISVREDSRQQGIAATLMADAKNRQQRDGVRWVIADGRCPSYNGGNGSPPNVHFPQNLQFKQVIDEYVEKLTTFNATKRSSSSEPPQLPAHRLLAQDPVLGMYSRTGFEFQWIMPNFVKNDEPSGNHRVILLMEYNRTP